MAAAVLRLVVVPCYPEVVGSPPVQVGAVAENRLVLGGPQEAQEILALSHKLPVAAGSHLQGFAQ